MKITQNTNLSTRKNVVLATVILLLLIGVLIAFEKTGVTNFVQSPSENNSGPTESEKTTQNKADQKEKEDFIKSPDPVTDQPSDTSNPVSIDLSANQESNGSVTVLSKLYGVDSGTCKLTITNGSREYVATADIIYQPDFSSCAGFSISKDKLGAGTWAVSLVINNEPKLEKSVSVEVK